MIKSTMPVQLRGSAHERGVCYGELLGPQISEAVERFKYQIQHVTGRESGLIISQFMATTHFVDEVQKWTPHLLDELRGIASVTGLAFDDLFVLQCQDEIQWWFRHFSEGAFSQYQERCSTLGTGPTRKQPTIVAQNLDHLGIYDGLECLLHIQYQDSPLECFVLSFAGLLALNGMNGRGVAVVCNALHKYLNNRIDGLPVTFVLRGVLESSDLQGALGFVRAVSHASGQSYVIGDPSSVICLECSANQVAPFLPFEHVARTFHTNHPLSSEDLYQPAVRKSEAGTTFDRFDYLAARMGDPQKDVSLDSIKFILSSHQGKAPICVHHGYRPDANYTLGSVICALTRDPTLYLSLGPPCIAGYQEFKFSASV